MLDLLEASREGPLGEFFSYPHPPFLPEWGVIGAGLRHDPLLVQLVAHEVDVQLGFPRDTVEFSAAVASVLAQITRGASGVSVLDASRIKAQWETLSRRQFERQVQPIQIELSIRDGFPIGLSEGRLEFYGDYHIIYRRVRRSRLHLAEPGGRIVPAPSGVPSWGTLGGFLESMAERQRVAVTAQHVLGQRTYAEATPAFAATDGFGVRRSLQYVSTLLPRSWVREAGKSVYDSPPQTVSWGQCSARQLSQVQVAGLDFALMEFPTSENSPPRNFTRTVRLAEISQALPLCFAGARSGFTSVRIASISVWHSYELPDRSSLFACIPDCLQIALRTRPYVWTDVSRGGDSGAWLMANSLEGPPQWLGVLVGGDGERSGVVPADRIIDQINTHYRHGFIPLV